MNLHSCTIVLGDDLMMTFHNVEQSLGVIDEHGTANIHQILIDATDGHNVHSYHNLSVEESIESLMNL